MSNWWDQPCIIGPSIGVNGYARFSSGDGGRLLAHRAVWEQAHGPIPEGHHVHHKCDTKACINLEHLDLLTKSEHHTLHSRKCGHDDRKARDGTCRICEREWRREYERRRYYTDPVYRAKKIARAAAFKRRKREEVLRSGSLV